jgi:hypothetical protein
MEQSNCVQLDATIALKEFATLAFQDFYLIQVHQHVFLVDTIVSIVANTILTFATPAYQAPILAAALAFFAIRHAQRVMDLQEAANSAFLHFSTTLPSQLAKAAQEIASVVTALAYASSVLKDLP